MIKKNETVAIIGASNNPERYAYKALLSLKAKGHTPLPVNPSLELIEGVKCFSSLQEIIDQEKNVDTVTLYVRPDISTNLEEILITLSPKRVIFNPGTENPSLQKSLKAQGIEALEACTLVMLNTNQF